MASTASDFSAAMAQHQVDFNAAYSALLGKVDAMRTIKGQIDVTVDNYLLLVQRAETAAGSGNTGGGTGGGGTTTPPSSNASLALMKSALALAPTTYESVPSGNSIVVTQGASNELPAFPGGAAPVLHYFSRNTYNNLQAPAGSADILTVTKAAAPETFSPAYTGESNWTQNNGQNSIQYQWCQEIGAHVLGFTTDARYFSFNVRFAGKDVTVKVNGILQPTITVSNGDSWPIVDTGSSGSKNIVFSSGGNECGGIAVPAGASLTPYDHMAGKFRANFLHDSWGQRRDYENRNMRLPDLHAILIGAHSVGGSVRGGTGYLQGDIPATDPQRRIDINAGSPHYVCSCMIVNDPDPAANANLQPAVATVLGRMRSDNPTAVIGHIVWASQGSRSTTVGGETRKRDLFKAEWDKLTGPKIFIDCMAGTWYADAGAGGGVKTRTGVLGPMITGEGSAESPTGTGNADTWIDNNGGRHPTSIGTIGIVNYVAARTREAINAIA